MVSGADPRRARSFLFSPPPAPPPPRPQILVETRAKTTSPGAWLKTIGLTPLRRQVALKILVEDESEDYVAGCLVEDER